MLAATANAQWNRNEHLNDAQWSRNQHHNDKTVNMNDNEIEQVAEERTEDLSSLINWRRDNLPVLAAKGRLLTEKAMKNLLSSDMMEIIHSSLVQRTHGAEPWGQRRIEQDHAEIADAIEEITMVLNEIDAEEPDRRRRFPLAAIIQGVSAIVQVVGGIIQNARG